MWYYLLIHGHLISSHAPSEEWFLLFTYPLTANSFSPGDVTSLPPTQHMVKCWLPQYYTVLEQSVEILWVREYSCCVLSRSHHPTTFLFILKLLLSFCTFSWWCGEGACIDVTSSAESSTVTNSHHFAQLWIAAVIMPVTQEDSVTKVESSANLWASAQIFRRWFDYISN